MNVRRGGRNELLTERWIIKATASRRLVEGVYYKYYAEKKILKDGTCLPFSPKEYESHVDRSNMES